MPFSLTWLDHDANARERTLRILSLFQEKETRDELGLGGIRDSFADQLFPGTSTIQTRLRYMLFVPWTYRSLEEKKVPSASFAENAEKLERELIKPLLDSGDSSGAFGLMAGTAVKRLPSSVYWAGLGSWGIRHTPFSQDVYCQRIDETYRSRSALQRRSANARTRGDDLDHDRLLDAGNWHPALPMPPDDFPSKASFMLTREEAEFVRDRIQVTSPDSLLAYLALRCDPADVQGPWEHPDYGSFPDNQKELLTHARLFSEVMHGAALCYNVQLAGLRKQRRVGAESLDPDELLSKHQASFDEWASSLPLKAIREWSIEQLWALTVGHGHTIGPKTKRFVERWIEYTRADCTNILSNEAALNLIREREIDKKGREHSRFENKKALEQWGGYSGTARLVYRWPNVKVLLKDLHQGLQGEEKC